MKEEMKKDILELKEKLALAGVDTRNLVYMPFVPIIGQHEFVIEEWFGMRVGRLVSN